jgi:hypothetical protein
MILLLAGDLLHLPDEPAGVAKSLFSVVLAGVLLHLPGEPAGVEKPFFREWSVASVLTTHP